MKITFYTRLWINSKIYNLLFQKIIQQLEKEVTFQLNHPSNFPEKTGEYFTVFLHNEENFLRKLRKLRRLYIKTINNFGKFAERLQYYLTNVILLGFISLIVIFGVIGISLKEGRRFDSVYCGVIIRFIVLFSCIWINVLALDRIDSCVSIALFILNYYLY